MEKLLGTVKWFSKEKGYGFIFSGGKDYFFHWKEVAGSGYKNPQPNERVLFLGEIGNRGLVAKSIEIQNAG